MQLLDRPAGQERAIYRVRGRPPRSISIYTGLIEIGLCSGGKNLSPAWCSAANPFSEQPKFAIGFSGHVIELSGDEGTFTPASGMIDRDDSTFGVDWLDHNTIVSGGRRGEVCLWDRRSRGQSMRFRHPAQINHVRKLEGSRIAVAGTNESVSKHDVINSLSARRPLI